MKIVHAVNKVTEELVRTYFVDEEGNEIADYTVEEYRLSIKRDTWK